MSQGKTKSAHDQLRDMLKKNASCNSEITVFVIGEDEQIGVVRKTGAELFVPPSVTERVLHDLICIKLAIC